MNRTLDNGLDLLMFLAEAPEPHGVSELAQAMELPPSHIHRLLQTLVAKRYVVQDAKRRYAIGLGALRLGSSLLRDIPLRRVALPFMQKLVGRSRWSASLSMPFWPDAIVVAHVAHGGQVRPKAETLGAVLTPLGSASGKLMLALADEQARETQLAELDFGSDQSHGYPTADAFRSELAEIAESGISIRQPPQPSKAFSFAMPVLGPDHQPVAALGLAIPPHASRPDPDRLAALISHLSQATEELQLQLQKEQRCPQLNPA